MAPSVPKCKICRKDKQKCNSQPGQKCERCRKNGYQCSGYRTTREERRSGNGLQPTPPPPPSMPSTIREHPLFQRCLLLLIYGRMLSHVESVADGINARMQAGHRYNYGGFATPMILLKIKSCLNGIDYQLCLLLEICQMNNVSDRAELLSAIQARIKAHPRCQHIESRFSRLLEITATGTESRRLYDAEHSLADIEREMENVINVPILYNQKGSNGQFAETFIRSLKSLGKRFLPIIDDQFTPVPFVHDFWYQHVGERDAFFEDELRAPILPMLCLDSLRRTPLHFAVEKFLFQYAHLVKDGERTRTIFAAGADVQLLLQSHHPCWQIDAQDGFGRTALHIACAVKDDEEPRYQSWIIETLLDNSARIDIIDEYGKRAIDYAIIDHNYSVLEVFERKRRLNLASVYSAMDQARCAIGEALQASK